MPQVDTIARAPSRTGRRVSLADVGLEFVSHPGNWVFLGLVLGIAAGLLASGPEPRDLLWLGVGWLVFIPQEYFTHVHLLHAPIPRTLRLYTRMYRLHYGHHDHPRRHDLMYMPLWLTVPMMLGNVVLLWALAPAQRAFWVAFGGALVSYLVFEWTHLLCHVPYVPRSRLWRNVRTQHLLHHFSNEKRGFAVAPWSLFMDRLMRTHAYGDAARSPSCRHLGLHAGHSWVAHARNQFAGRSSGDPTCSRLWLWAGSNKE
jgi:hypothetical protein